MKICLNFNLVEGPFGGAMQFGTFLSEKLVKKGYKVVNNLKDDDIDVILHVSPFKCLGMQSSSFSFFDAYSYKLAHPNTIIILRVNECDERKDTNYMNNLLNKISVYSDFVIFISDWLENLFNSKFCLMKKRISV